MNKVDEEFFVKQVCRLLDASIAHLPLSIDQSLTQTRQAALLQNAHLAQAVSRKLDDNSALSTDIEARLDQIRHSAVARFEQLQEETAQTNGFSLSAWIKTQLDSFNFTASAGMLTTACVMVTAIAIFYLDSRPAGTVTLDEEIGLIATAEDIELYENLEFYLWLAENESLIL